MTRVPRGALWDAPSYGLPTYLIRPSTSPLASHPSWVRIANRYDKTAAAVSKTESLKTCPSLAQAVACSMVFDTPLLERFPERKRSSEAHLIGA